MTTDRLLLLNGYNSSSAALPITYPEDLTTKQIEIKPFSNNIKNKQELPEQTAASDNVAKTPHRHRHKPANIKQIIKEHKDDPMGAIDALGLDLTDEQKAEVVKFINTTKELKAFLEFAANESLTEEDMVAGFKATRKHKHRGFWGRVWQGVTHPTEAISYWTKGETVYIAQKTSENMGEIREVRNDMSSDAVAEIGFDCVERPEQKARTRHLIMKQDVDGSFVYDEASIVDDHRYMMNLNEEKAEKHIADIVELESIKTPDGHIKYKGKTIVRVGRRMTENENLRDTMVAAAKKADMTDEYLDNITDNLEKNPEMEESVRFTVTAKDKDGKDRFSAQNANACSDYLVDKNKETCQSYFSGLQQMSANENLSGNNIIEVNNLAHDNPDYTKEVINRACNATDSNISGDDIVNDCKNYIAANNGNIKDYKENSDANIKENSIDSVSSETNELKTAENTQSTASVSEDNAVNKTQNKLLAASNPIEQQKEASNDEKTISYNGTQYKRSVILKELSDKFGPSAERILQKIEEDPSFIDLMKKYGNNKSIRNAILDDPTIVSKLKGLSATITTSDLADMVTVCKDTKRTKALVLLSNIISPQAAADYVKHSSNTDDLINVLENSSINRKQKLEYIKMLTGKA